MAKYRLKLVKEFFVDTSKWPTEIEDDLRNYLPGSARREATEDQLHDAIRDALGDDMEYYGADLGDIDHTDFEIEVLDPSLRDEDDDHHPEADDKGVREPADPNDNTPE